MKMTLLLIALGFKLLASALFSKAFRKKIRYINRTVVIRTADGKHSHTYIFRRNMIFFHPGGSKNATVELIWSDKDTALKVMLSKEELDTFSAMGKGDLVIKGNFQDALWFTEIAA
ncbi:hypothetical protein [Kistimonas asteriae]|uniref:hypothetical protein n=1 Tax=Kistimonas asteriae TaxID=517724 RepID=UPI001BA65DD5|nr:hypothetical protein [Kistimonas asteriae]